MIDTTDVVEIRITLCDPLYYVSGERGDHFVTKPYLMHTALYYACGLLPTAFRVPNSEYEGDGPFYEEHYQDSEIAQQVYLHPAVSITEDAYLTRRFAVRSSEYRVEAERTSGNIKQTGFQQWMLPGATFRTYAVMRPTADGLTSEEFCEQLPTYIRVGKKMATARVETRIYTGEIVDGVFTLGQPVADEDLDLDRYAIKRNVTFEPMLPTDLLLEADLEGPHVTITAPERGDEGRLASDSKSVSLPTDISFLGFQNGT